MEYMVIQYLINFYLDDVKLVVIDNLSTLCNYGKENESESWLPVQKWLLDLRRRGIACLIVHHAGKSGQQRGTSRKEDILDTVITLKRPNNYESAEGARIEIHLDKARGIYGEAAKPFEAELITSESGNLYWETRDIEDVQLEQVRELLDTGLSIRDIAEETGMSKSTIQRLKKVIMEQK